LNKPVVSTDITGPSEFLKSNGCGLVVENSEAGLVDGFNAYNDGRLESLKKFDAEAFNKSALEEFYAIIR
jgi:glycosyltransferase involved in cell wall biosynthesis